MYGRCQTCHAICLAPSPRAASRCSGRHPERRPGRGERADVVLREADLARVALADQGGDVVGAALVGGEDLEADAVDADERAALGELADRRDVGLLVLVADEHTTEVGAAVGEEVLLHVAVPRVLGVRDDRAARPRAARARRRSRHRDSARVTSRAGGRLDRAGADAAGAGDALGELLHVELGDLLGITRPPVDRQAPAEVLGVEAGGAHDAASPTATRSPRRARDRARARSGTGRRTCGTRRRAARPSCRPHARRSSARSHAYVRVELLAVVRDADVLVDERAPEVGAVDGSGDGLHGAS